MNFSDIGNALLVHLRIVFTGIFFGCLIGIPIGSLLREHKTISQIIFTIVDIIQTVPTLAMFTFLMLIFGLNNSTVIFSIFLYSLFPIVRNTYTGIKEVDKGVIRAGRGIGMTEMQIYFKLELPLAMPVILSGVRLALISALSIATTGVLIGAGGLGMLIWRGIQTRNMKMMLSGAIPVSLLAIMFDILLSILEKRISRRSK
ncbi:ABC transporter permease [Miniphocaeibacter halophilus]|uniref:ABC transporter permease n=1 Tax=Miniphocaeibacter halophilus TaxID=2931922 RepID=A0AC61MTN9_9FIRM|nr:ABC transporter permease [Miniphocaeibacter halophilus]QQK08728.1 ABC transporter permease [Miniphocaeibacter halophilus]